MLQHRSPQAFVKATFFVDRWNKLDSWEIEILNNLSKDGHEIGFHSRSHGDYFEFLEQNNIVVDDEQEEEIDDELDFSMF